MWNMKCTIIPVIIGATGIVTRSLRKNYLEAIPGKHWIDSLHRTATLGTSHIIREVLQGETCGLSGGDHRCFKGSTRKTSPVTRDDGDDDDDDDDDDNNNHHHSLNAFCIHSVVFFSNNQHVSLSTSYEHQC